MDFEDADTGEEITLQADLTYQVVETFVTIDENVPHFTYRVKLARFQFGVKQGYEGSQDLAGIEVIDLEEVPDTPEGV
jgi:hypothetical protein